MTSSTNTELPSRKTEEDSKKSKKPRLKEKIKILWSKLMSNSNNKPCLAHGQSGLLGQFYATLSATSEGLQIDLDEKYSHLQDRLTNIFEKPPSWSNAYCIEQLQIHMMQGDKLDTELSRRLAEAQKVKLPLVDFYEKHAQPIEAGTFSDDYKRSMLNRLANDLQWFYSQRIQRRNDGQVMAFRVGIIFFLSFTLFIAGLIAFIYFENRNVAMVDDVLKILEGFLIALVSGFFGASFSMLVQTQNRISSGTLEDLRAGYRWFVLIIRAAVGLGAAMILYFFFESELLGGSLWPDLNKLGLSSIKDANGLQLKNTFAPNKEVCLLVIWCFIAGFSENFVPNVLVKTESKGQAT
jgi:hypothetical protein